MAKPPARGSPPRGRQRVEVGHRGDLQRLGRTRRVGRGAGLGPASLPDPRDPRPRLGRPRSRARSRQAATIAASLEPLAAGVALLPALVGLGSCGVRPLDRGQRAGALRGVHPEDPRCHRLIGGRVAAVAAARGGPGANSGPASGSSSGVAGWLAWSPGPARRRTRSSSSLRNLRSLADPAHAGVVVEEQRGAYFGVASRSPALGSSRALTAAPPASGSAAPGRGTARVASGSSVPPPVSSALTAKRPVRASSSVCGRNRGELVAVDRRGRPRSLPARRRPGHRCGPLSAAEISWALSSGIAESDPALSTRSQIVSRGRGTPYAHLARAHDAAVVAGAWGCATPRCRATVPPAWRRAARRGLCTSDSWSLSGGSPSATAWRLPAPGRRRSRSA